MSAVAAPAAIAGRLALVRARIAAACDRAGRDSADVTLIGVTKTWPAACVVEAWEAGLTDAGENRVQEALAKRAVVNGAGARLTWHLAGHLQGNKARAAVEAFEVVHSVDSTEIAERISSLAQRLVPVFLEVNVAAEATKQGFAPADLGVALERCRALPGIEVVGLMTVAPAAHDPEQVRPVFRLLAGLARAHGLAGLSMGMSGDFEVAIEEGATHVRIGRAIFGERQA